MNLLISTKGGILLGKTAKTFRKRFSQTLEALPWFQKNEFIRNGSQERRWLLKRYKTGTAWEERTAAYK